MNLKGQLALPASRLPVAGAAVVSQTVTINYNYMPLPHAEHSTRRPGYEARKQRLDITVQLKQAVVRQHLQLHHGHDCELGFGNFG